ncbi:LytR/AlgR family response regulator transcription factor [Melaminivora alkalimesophila]|uniref:LytTR family two component transcriptional regulator n=1 Tax=Melaminivora alkalimesophila TaxID=1165852 RepID=A0A317RBI5_9BURK|nr:LytTR family DNA-binding domain-containing protein [Melaminivora alkalimesophila]PWW46022.1 LytTR family two component transcriptional regulator [Melaminivora alkalimesophila]
MHILIADDETLARSRLRRLLHELDPGLQLSEAQHGAEALALLGTPAARPVDVALLDIHMPGMNGLALAHEIQRLPAPPAIVFVTAHADHAVDAFELDAVDYLTKPVRRERLQQALAKAERSTRGHSRLATAPPAPQEEVLLIQEPGRTERVPLSEVLYLRAELKYVTVRTLARSYVIDDALTELEARHPGHFLRVHRNTLVARHALRALVRHDGSGGEPEGWAVRLQGLTQPLAVSRRQMAAVREALND